MEIIVLIKGVCKEDSDVMDAVKRLGDYIESTFGKRLYTYSDKLDVTLEFRFREGE